MNGFEPTGIASLLLRRVPQPMKTRCAFRPCQNPPCSTIRGNFSARRPTGCGRSRLEGEAVLPGFDGISNFDGLQSGSTMTRCNSVRPSFVGRWSAPRSNAWRARPVFRSRELTGIRPRRLPQVIDARNPPEDPAGFASKDTFNVWPYTRAPSVHWSSLMSVLRRAPFSAGALFAYRMRLRSRGFDCQVRSSGDDGELCLKLVLAVGSRERQGTRGWLCSLTSAFISFAGSHA